MLRSRMGRLLGATLFLCSALGEISPFARLLAHFCGVAYTANGSRGDGTYLVGLNGHDYAPSVMKDGNTYKVWWCSNNNGREDIMYSTTTNLDHWPSWSAPISVLQPTGTSTFDSGLVCDPSVIRVGATYYLYYGGCETACVTTRMGVASSPDGINWTRLNGGQPIVTPARGPTHPAWGGLSAGQKYGAGQPSVTYVEGKFYLALTDTTAISVDPNDMNTTSLFVMRSADPTFQSGVEELTGPGKFTGYNPALERPYAFFTQHDISLNMDWQFVDATDQFLIATLPR